MNVSKISGRDDRRRPIVHDAALLEAAEGVPRRPRHLLQRLPPVYDDQVATLENFFSTAPNKLERLLRPAFTHKYKTWLESVARDKYSSLFATKKIKFYNIDTRCRCYKTFYSRKL